MNRCVYCGRSQDQLYWEAPDEVIALCSCCDHCYECMLLVTKHKPLKTKEKDEELQFGYAYQTAQSDWRRKE